MKKLPVFLKEYFWDVDFKKMSLKSHRSFIIKRVLDRGDAKAIRWLFKNFKSDEIQNLLLTTKDLSQKTANFWADYFELDRKKVPCLQKPYSRIQFGLSS